jgi:PAS domain S-box-containing protein
MEGPELRYTRANPEYQALTGSNEPILGRRFGDAFPEMAGTDPERRLLSVMETGEPWEIAEYAAPIPGKPEALWEGRAVRLPGTPPAVLVLCREISGQVRTHESLRRRDAERRAVFEAIDTAIVILDKDGRQILDANPAFLELHNLTRAELAELAPMQDWALAWELLYPDGRPVPFEDWPLNLLLRGEDVRGVEMRTRSRRTGAEFSALYNGAWVRGDSGEVLALALSATNITVRRRALDSLRESEERMRLALVAARMGTFELRTKTGEVYWDSAGRELLGFAPGAPVDYRQILDRVHPGDRDRLESTARHAIASGADGSLETEFRIVRPDGSVHTALVVAMMNADGEGSWARRLVGVCMDITERKQLEEQLRRRVEELETVMDVAPAAIWVAADPACSVITGNRMANELYEAREGENVSANVTAVRRYFQAGRELAPEDLPMQRAAALGIEIRDAELGLVLPSGRSMSILGHASPLRDDDGRVRGCVGAFLDMTARKAAEEARRRSEARLEAVLNQMPSGVMVINAATGRVEFASRQAERIEGAAARAPGEMSYREAYHLDGRPFLPGEWPSARAAAGDTVNEEVEYRQPDGSRAVLQVRAAPVRGSDGIIEASVVVVDDITESRRSEERLREAQKLESIGLLAGGIAHDFNNLLTGVMGNVSMVIDEVPPRAAARLRAVEDCAERAAHLTRQLLAYAGKGQFVTRELNLSSELRGMADLLRLSVPKNVELRLDLGERLPPVAMDPAQFQQVVMNLAINAGEAIGETDVGRIAIGTTMRDISRGARDAAGEEVQPGRYVCLEVRDTGPGMDERTRARIFEPFFTTKFTGRGLGLAAVSGIVRSLKGAIDVETAPGTGTAFRVFLPAGSQALEPASAAGGERGLVLVVDDEEQVRAFVGAAVCRNGYSAIAAADGAEAVAQCDGRWGILTAVVLDIIMPVMGGGEFLRELRRRRPDVRVVLTSGYSEAEARRLCADYEGCAFLQKPFTLQRLMEAIESPALRD